VLFHERLHVGAVPQRSRAGSRTVGDQPAAGSREIVDPREQQVLRLPGKLGKKSLGHPGRRPTTVEPAGKKGSGPVLTQVYVNQLMPSSWNDTERGEHIGLETKRRTAVQFEDGRVAP
jgi:hypothetical protein